MLPFPPPVFQMPSAQDPGPGHAGSRTLQHSPSAPAGLVGETLGGSWVGWLANIPKGCIKLKTQMFRFHVSVSLLDFSEVNGAEKGAGPVGPGWVQLERFKPVNFGILLKSLRWFLQKSTYVEW